MDVAIALRDVASIALAFLLGLLSRSVGLPRLVGFLAAGFLLNLHGTASGEMLQKLSDIGITLLLFLVGLKLDLRTLARPQVWAVAGLHMSMVVLVLGTAIHMLALLGVSFLTGIDFSRALLIAFALSFSSTVFVVKVLEERGETARYGETVVGVDIDPRTVGNHRSAGLKVLLGDPSDADFWDRLRGTNAIELVMLTLPNLTASLAVLDQLRAASFRGRVAATARFPDEIEPLERAGAAVVFNVYEKAGAGFAAQVAAQDTTPLILPRGIG